MVRSHPADTPHNYCLLWTRIIDRFILASAQLPAPLRVPNISLPPVCARTRDRLLVFSIGADYQPGAARQKGAGPPTTAPRDTVLLVKWETEMLFDFACGGLRGAAHNQLSHRPNTARTSSAVPLGCGQLRAGIALRSSPHTVDLPALLPIVRVKHLSFCDHSIRQMQQLARCRAARHLRRFARCAQPLILRANEWIVACGTQGCHIQCCSKTWFSCMPDLSSSSHTRPRLTSQWHQAGICRRFARPRGRKVQRADQQPSSRH